MTETVPERITMGNPLTGEVAEYVLATALEAAQARIAELEAEKREAALRYLADAGQLSDALATARLEALEEADRAVHDRLVKIPHYDDARIVARSTIRALMEKPNANG